MTLRKQVCVCVEGGGGCWGSVGRGGEERRDLTRAQLRSGGIKARVCGDRMVKPSGGAADGGVQGAVGPDTA